MKKFNFWFASISGALMIIAIMVFNIRTSPNVYADCGRWHITYQGGYITLNEKTSQYPDNPFTTTYKASKGFLEDRASWSRLYDNCEGTGDYAEFYKYKKNPFHTFQWDNESGKGSYRSSEWESGSKAECKILPKSSAPDWVKWYGHSRAINVKC
ncbi:uncharacterized protein METZ01_LOCUS165274 [marine metagenome]|uniref:Uncharacterized protein n=1 Tax=marine metagenome TaxID=408172 RepID=A0A382BEY9_9ZZZZ